MLNPATGNAATEYHYQPKIWPRLSGLYRFTVMKQRMIRILATIVATAVAGSMGCSYLISAIRPQMPAEWSALRVGMSREEVLKVSKGEARDLREAKGFDSITQPTTMFGFPSYWQLLITYDASNGLSSAEANFIHQTYGFMSTKPKKIL